jgi:hypothetical protein
MSKRETVLCPDLYNSLCHYQISYLQSYTHPELPMYYIHIKVKLSLCLTNKHLRHEDVWGSRCIDMFS